MSQVETVGYTDLEPEEFYRKYISPRQPVVINGCLAESEGWRAGRWSNDYLRERVGLVINVPGQQTIPRCPGMIPPRFAVGRGCVDRSPAFRGCNPT